jgi:4,5:9,10-diseco-3-hydroxy-5,9,17-trioxoandrosta-1(10),2-diene-4-oate hydrolase
VLGVDLAVHDGDPSGSKPALVCLHAIGHGGGDFVGLEQAFGAAWRVITVDWPDQGRSGHDGEPASARRYTALFSALVDELRLERVVLLGNSIGGAVAISYAAQNPTRVRALVLANPGGLDEGASGLLGRVFIGFTVAHFEQGVRGEAAFEPWFRSYYEGILVTFEAQERRAEIVAAGYESAPVLAQAWDSFRQPEANLVPLLPRLSMPVLVTWARRDGIVQWSRNRAAVESIPRAKVVFFEAGHAPFLETPGPFNAELSSFLQALSR